MIKKAFVCLLFMLAMMMFTVHIVGSTVHHIDGVNYSYSSEMDPVYSECNHDTYPGASDNTEVGLGVRAEYYSAQYFDHAWWDFNGQYGNGDVAMYTGLLIDPCVNGDEHNYYTYNGAPVWTTPSGAWYQCWYVHYEINPNNNAVYIGYKASVEGYASTYFYHPSDPPYSPTFGELWFLDAYTQNPSNPNDPNGWSFLHAWDD